MWPFRPARRRSPAVVAAPAPAAQRPTAASPAAIRPPVPHWRRLPAIAPVSDGAPPLTVSLAVLAPRPTRSPRPAGLPPPATGRVVGLADVVAVLPVAEPAPGPGPTLAHAGPVERPSRRVRAARAPLTHRPSPVQATGEYVREPVAGPVYRPPQWLQQASAMAQEVGLPLPEPEPSAAPPAAGRPLSRPPLGAARRQPATTAPDAGAAAPARLGLGSPVPVERLAHRRARSRPQRAGTRQPGEDGAPERSGRDEPPTGGPGRPTPVDGPGRPPPSRPERSDPAVPGSAPPTPPPRPSVASPAPDVEPVPDSVSAAFAAHHGVDVSRVPVFRGRAAGERARRLGARAFSQGGAVFVPADQGALDSAQGRTLLGHELTHVVQQRAHGPGLSAGSPLGRELERRATATGRWFQGGEAGPMPAPLPHPARPNWGGDEVRQLVQEELRSQREHDATTAALTRALGEPQLFGDDVSTSDIEDALYEAAQQTAELQHQGTVEREKWRRDNETLLQVLQQNAAGGRHVPGLTTQNRPVAAPDDWAQLRGETGLGLLGHLGALLGSEPRVDQRNRWYRWFAGRPSAEEDAYHASLGNVGDEEDEEDGGAGLGGARPDRRARRRTTAWGRAAWSVESEDDDEDDDVDEADEEVAPTAGAAAGPRAAGIGGTARTRARRDAQPPTDTDPLVAFTGSGPLAGSMPLARSTGVGSPSSSAVRDGIHRAVGASAGGLGAGRAGGSPWGLGAPLSRSAADRAREAVEQERRQRTVESWRDDVWGGTVLGMTGLMEQTFGLDLGTDLRDRLSRRLGFELPDIEDEAEDEDLVPGPVEPDLIQPEEMDLDGLSDRVYDRVRSRIRRELLIDRERAGVLADLR